MVNGIDHFFKSNGFTPKFVNDYDEFTIEFKIHDPRIVILDDDIKGKKYYYQIFVEVETRRKHTKKDITLIGCTAHADWKDIRKEYLRQGYDEFFENDGSPESLEKILAYINKIVN